jgi:HNH endonuclease
MPTPIPLVKLVCLECGVEFERQRAHIRRPGAGKFCSRPCLWASRRRGSVLHCALCDSEFYRHNAEQDIGVKVNQFCSRPCYMEWRAINRGDTYPKSGAVHVHRIVAASILGRPLAPGEVVHHVDEDKQNSHPANLAVFPDQATHARCHAGGMSDDELRGFLIVKG